MPVKFDHAYRPFQSPKPATESELKELLGEAQMALPDDYRAFLLTVNGGSVRPFAFKLEIPGSTFDKSIHALDYLYEARELSRRSQLRLPATDRSIPPGRLAIGTTVSQLTLTIDITNAGNGRIEAWVTDTGNVWGEGANRTVVPLAESFSAMLELLEACPKAYSSFWASIEEDAETTVRQITLPT